MLNGFLFGSLMLSAQVTSVDLNTPLVSDPAVKTGKLSNGLSYYIRQNHKPEKRVELRLVVNAGSILENDDQQGLAHFMEHMNFNGTKTFPKNELIDFLQKTGVRFGADINASTGFDETVYMLQLPTDDSLLVEKGFQVLEDWAHNALLDDKEIDKERGIIVEEWRLGLGAQDRMMKKFLPVILKDSRYADRLPIGKVDVIETFKPETLKSFYHDWYRPDLQAIVVVGDINPDQVEARIKAHFEKIPAAVSPRERTVYGIPSNNNPLIAVATDIEATNNVVMIFYKHPQVKLNTLADFRQQITAELFTGMLNNRLNEISQKPESPYIFANADYGNFLARGNDAYMLTALSKESRIDESLKTILEENQRVKQFGFTPTEFERQKEEMMSNYEKASREFDKTESSRLTGEYIDHFLTGDAYPTARKKLLYLIHLLPDIKLEEINALAGSWATDTNMAMVVMAPEKESVKVPAKDQLLEVVAQAQRVSLTPYVDNFKEEALVGKELTPSGAVSRTENKELGFTEIKLSNGVTVVLKPTEFKNDEILFSGYSLGGNSLYPDADYLSAYYASQVISLSGAGTFDNIQLEKKLKGKNLRINPYIDEVRQGFKGSCTPKDLETLLQLLYLYYDSPRKDTMAFEAFISQMTNQVRFMKSNPIISFYDTLFKVSYPGYKRLVLFPSEAQIGEIRLDDLYRIFRERFSDASEARFFLVGNFNIDSITPLITRYMGSLPAPGRKDQFKDRSPQFPKGVTDVTFNKGTDPQSMVGMIFSEKFDWNQNNLLAISILKEILSIKLVEVIREKMSGVYSPQIQINPDHYPVSQYQLMVMFGCSPSTTGKLSKAVLGEIKKIYKKGPTEADLQKAKESLIRDREVNLEKNDFWQGKLESLYFDNTAVSSIVNFKEEVSALTVETLRATYQTLLDPGNYVRVVLMPEKK